MNPFTPLEYLSQDGKTNNQVLRENPVFIHSKHAWQEIHKWCGTSHLRQPYASLWYNSAIRTGK